MHKVVYGLEFSCIQVVYGLELTAYTNVFMLLILCQLHNFNLVNHATDRQCQQFFITKHQRTYIQWTNEMNDINLLKS